MNRAEYEIAQRFKVHPKVLDWAVINNFVQLHLNPEHMIRSYDTLPPVPQPTMASAGQKRQRSALLKDEAELPSCLPTSPKRAALLRIYTDLLQYLYLHTKRWYFGNHVGGCNTWERLSLSQCITIVLTVPNGWEIDEQLILQKAALAAGIVDDEDHLEFLTEGEGSLHYLLARNSAWLKPGMKVAMTDAGGSTVDFSLYECIAIDPKPILKEVTPSRSILVSLP
jgi:hypothetical protein